MIKLKYMNVKILENKFQLKNDLALDFYSGIKNPCDFRVGAEVERINVFKDSFEAVPYSIIEQFLDVFGGKYGWQKIRENNHILALRKDNDFISLEPGSQLEMSLAPVENIHQLARRISELDQNISQISELLGFYSLGYGIQPVSVYDHIGIIPKKRYDLMTEYFIDKGKMAYVMMRETAGTQVSLDYSSEEDAISKLRLGLLLAPVISSMFSNSPVRGGQKTGYKSFRAKSWLATDDDRCGFISPKLFDSNYEFTFDDYVDALLDVPMIFIMREGRSHRINTTFRDYFQNGYEGFSYTIDDWKLHQNLYFPEVRLKNFLEFRNADAQSPDMTLALMALYKGIFYDNEAISEAYLLFEGVGFKDLQKMRHLTPMYALGVKVGKVSILDLAKELISIAKKSLQRQNSQDLFGHDESIYLNVLIENIIFGKTPADRLLEICGGDVSKIVACAKINPL